MTADTTIQAIVAADSWTQRIQQIRLVPQRHGTEEHGAIYAAVARIIYMPHLAPDFAYIHESSFYETAHFFTAYDEAIKLTDGFLRVTEHDIQDTINKCPLTLLVFRTLLGLTRDEFAHATQLAGAPDDLTPLTSSQVDTMERTPRDIPRPRTPAALSKAATQAQIAAKTVTMAMNGLLFGEPPDGLRSKQQKPDTERGWESVRAFATNGVPLRVFLHQRHYGGAFRQILDATSTLRGNSIEDAVEALFTTHGVSFIRTGSHNQADVARRFECMSRKIEKFDLAHDDTYTIPEDGQDFYLGEGDAAGWVVAVDRTKGKTVEMFNLRHITHIIFAEGESA